MSTPSTSTQRIVVADVLRGFSVLAICLLHSIEHFNYYSASTSQGWLQFADKAVWDGLFFAFGGKAYAIFALLFGFSYYIQECSATRKGVDFRGRFMWRLLLLFVIGCINAAMMTGEVLVLYALVGFVLPLFSRCSNRVVLAVALFLLLQPMEWGRILYALIHPAHTPVSSLDSPFWGYFREAQATGSLWVMVKTNLWEGQLASLAWAFENARLFQTPALFLMGMLIGRTALFTDTPSHRRIWLGVLVGSLLLYFPLSGITPMLSEQMTNPVVRKSLLLILTSLYKFAFMSLLVSTLWLLYHHFAGVTTLLNHLSPYGRMSLTNYLTQSLVGTAIFYNWGLGLKVGSLYSVLIGVVLFVVQYLFCIWWLRHHKQGPLEWMWKQATWWGAAK